MSMVSYTSAMSCTMLLKALAISGNVKLSSLHILLEVKQAREHCFLFLYHAFAEPHILSTVCMCTPVIGSMKFCLWFTTKRDECWDSLHLFVPKQSHDNNAHNICVYSPSTNFRYVMYKVMPKNGLLSNF